MNHEPGLRDIAIDELHPHRLHRAAPAGELDRHLMESIRELGILSRLIVRSDGTIIAGKRRWEAAKALGLATVPCQVTDMSDVELRDLINREPTFRVPIRPVEYARQLRRILDSGQVDVPGLALRIGKAEGWVRDRLSLLDLVPEVAAAIDAADSVVNLKTAFRIAKLPAEDQPAALAASDTARRAAGVSRDRAIRSAK